MTNYKMVIAYDGKRYKGFRKTKEQDDKTIQGKLEAILKKLYETDIEIIGAVNTDAGVHALNQVINFKAPNDTVSQKEILNYFNEFLPEDIIIKSIEAVDERFHSRYNIDSITYQYRLWKKDAKQRPLFERQYINSMDRHLDVPAMRYAATKLIGEHDFTAFATKSKVNNALKTIFDVTIEETENEIIIAMCADGFLLNMERIIVGTLIQIGLGQKHADTIERAFKTKGSDDVGHKVMSHALCLLDVKTK